MSAHSHAECAGYREGRPNLTQADLREAILSEADLGAATLKRTTMNGAAIRETNLSSADLWWAQCIKAVLSQILYC